MTLRRINASLVTGRHARFSFRHTRSLGCFRNPSSRRGACDKTSWMVCPAGSVPIRRAHSSKPPRWSARSTTAAAPSCQRRRSRSRRPRPACRRRATPTAAASTSSSPSRAGTVSADRREGGLHDRRWSTTSWSRSGARMRVDFSIQVGQVSERVQVTASTPLIERDSSQRGQVITGEQIRELALNGREYSSLALMAPGVRQSALNKSESGHAARGRLQRQRPAQHLQQLPDRRRGQQRLRHEQPGLLESGDAAAA